MRCLRSLLPVLGIVVWLAAGPAGLETRVAAEDALRTGGEAPPAEAAAPPPAEPAGTAPAEPPETKPALEFSREQLEGNGEDDGKVAAVQLIGAISTRTRTAPTDPVARQVRQEHLALLQSYLEPESIDGSSSEPSRIAAARRVVQVLGSLAATGGPPFPEMVDTLFPLLGRGRGTFRAALVQSLVSLGLWERRQYGVAGEPSAAGPGDRPKLVVDRLGDLLEGNPAPPPPVLEDASNILWRVDGKRFLRHAVSGLAANYTSFPEAARGYVSELRKRLIVDFTTVEAWQAWWTENKNRSLEDILLASQRKLSADLALTWERTVKRLRESGDVERVITEIQETLQSAYTEQLRVKAVEALGEFADWLRGLKLTPNGINGAEDVRSRLLERAGRLLLDVARGRQRPLERPEVVRAALVALRKYQNAIERSPELSKEVSELVLEWIPDLRRGVGEESPPAVETSPDLLEAVRTAGVLRVVAARPLVEALVARLVARPLDAVGMELLTAAVGTLGRLHDGNMTLTTASLLVQVFRLPTVAGDESLAGAYRALRRASLTALNAPPADEEVRVLMRTLYVETLSEGNDRELRIPAILGLGTLAQATDEESLGALVGLVESPATLEPSEVIAALDSIAYVGGRRALGRFLSFLARRDELEARDKALADHVWRKCVGLLKSEGTAAVAWAFDVLEGRAVAEDAPQYLELVLLLGREPEVAELLKLDGVDPVADEEIGARWDARLLDARVEGLLGVPDEASRELRVLEEFLEKHPPARAALPQRVAWLEREEAREEKKKAVLEKLNEPATLENPAVLVGVFAQVVEASPGGRARWYSFRWIEKILGSPPFRDQAALVPVFDLWPEFLRSEEGQKLFEGLPEAFPTRHAERVVELKPSPAAPSPPGPTPPGGAPGGTEAGS